MQLIKTLNDVGRDVFVKYYYVFGNMTDEDCMELFTENYTEKSKKKRIACAKAIFNQGREYEALQIICCSHWTKSKTKNRALRILSAEVRRKRYGLLK